MSLTVNEKVVRKPKQDCIKNKCLDFPIRTRPASKLSHVVSLCPVMERIHISRDVDDTRNPPHFNNSSLWNVFLLVLTRTKNNGNDQHCSERGQVEQ